MREGVWERKTEREGETEVARRGRKIRQRTHQKHRSVKANNEE